MSETESIPEVINVGGYPAGDWKPEIRDTSKTTSLMVANPYAVLLQQAIEKGFDAERIGQILDLQDRMERREAEKRYVEAMVNVQARCPIVVRDKKNESTGSWFARLETVAIRIKPIYTEEGFILEYGEGDSPLEKHRRIICDVTHCGGHSKQFHLDSPIDDVGAKGTPNKTAIQGVGSMVSYLRRYLCLMIFNIVVADEDNDGNNDGELWTEEQIETIRAKMMDCEVAKVSVREYPFIEYLAKLQGNKDAKVFGDLTQKVFPRAVAELDKKLRKARNGDQA